MRRCLFRAPVCGCGVAREGGGDRQFPMDRGFEMAQFSTYLRFAENKKAVEIFIARIAAKRPDNAKVRIVTIADKRYGNARIFTGSKRERRPENPAQLALF